MNPWRYHQDSAVGCSNASAKFLNSAGELNQQFELSTLCLLEEMADWEEWPVQKSNHKGHQDENEENGLREHMWLIN